MAADAQTVWITGAGSGMGRAAALRFAREGWRVVLLGIPAAGLEAVQAEITAAGGTAEAVPLDVTERPAVQRAAAALLDGGARVDALINCAGITLPVRTWAEMPPADWERSLAVNLTGTFNTVHAVLPAMRAQGGGTILNVSSMGGKQVYAVAGPAYTAGKHGVVGLSHAINAEEGHHGIRCCVLCPGEVNTPILDNRPVPVPAEERARMIQPEDVAETMWFVAGLPARTTVSEVLLWPTHRRTAKPGEGSL